MQRPEVTDITTVTEASALQPGCNAPATRAATHQDPTSSPREPWAFDFIPEPSHPDPLFLRVAECIRDAEAIGLTVERVQIVTSGRGTEPPQAIKTRHLLKKAKRRRGLRAKWPTTENE